MSILDTFDNSQKKIIIALLTIGISAGIYTSITKPINDETKEIKANINVLTDETETKEIKLKADREKKQNIDKKIEEVTKFQERFPKSLEQKDFIQKIKEEADRLQIKTEKFKYSEPTTEILAPKLKENTTKKKTKNTININEAHLVEMKIEILGSGEEDKINEFIDSINNYKNFLVIENISLSEGDSALSQTNKTFEIKIKTFVGKEVELPEKEKTQKAQKTQV